MTQAKRDVARKSAVLRHAQQSRNVSKTCRHFGISRDTYYTWLHAYEQRGEAGLTNRRPGPVEDISRRVPLAVEEKIVEIRQSLGLGAQRLSWYLARYHGIKVSTGGVQGVLKRHGISRLPSLKGVRAPVAFRRYEQQVPGHQVQLDVKFVDLHTSEGKRVRRYQYTAIDDATRIRALRIYPKHNQACAIAFVGYVLEQFPFRIRQIRTDRGHEFQALFHWHVADLGIEHVYIKARTPRLNGKVGALLQSHAASHCPRREVPLRSASRSAIIHQQSSG